MAQLAVVSDTPAPGTVVLFESAGHRFAGCEFPKAAVAHRHRHAPIGEGAVSERTAIAPAPTFPARGQATGVLSADGELNERVVADDQTRFGDGLRAEPIIAALAVAIGAPAERTIGRIGDAGDIPPKRQLPDALHTHGPRAGANAHRGVREGIVAIVAPAGEVGERVGRAGVRLTGREACEWHGMLQACGHKPIEGVPESELAEAVGAPTPRRSGVVEGTRELATRHNARESGKWRIRRNDGERVRRDRRRTGPGVARRKETDRRESERGRATISRKTSKQCRHHDNQTGRGPNSSPELCGRCARRSPALARGALGRGAGYAMRGRIVAARPPATVPLADQRRGAGKIGVDPISWTPYSP